LRPVSLMSGDGRNLIEIVSKETVPSTLDEKMGSMRDL